ncbi:nuclear transport factor 2 family protein [Saccharopolyspora rhizosphaerae]|uniref:Nuclear transport factor 2 family protein n=1 Tax=Saccharopolyspora rhizosphaerae TaxID=2492662 RepID=A0A426JUT2_9PSEU|nr:nuclear transport factor 2 family protein [Saccharopolyspora rhizosphaerae]RRO16969.1 nuclear transport factor 2 family protein [Saccharopolyspora rhizosphaerae]
MSDLEARIRRLEDVHEIAQLRARYCQYLDDGRWDELAELFTEDGRFVGLSTAAGRSELRTFFAGLQGGPLAAWWHFSANETVTVECDVASGQTWLYQPCVVDGEPHVAAGRYTDSLVRTDGTWLFSERAVTFFWWVPLTEGWASGKISWGPARPAKDPRYAG